MTYYKPNVSTFCRTSCISNVEPAIPSRIASQFTSRAGYATTSVVLSAMIIKPSIFNTNGTTSNRYKPVDATPYNYNGCNTANSIASVRCIYLVIIALPLLTWNPHQGLP